MPDLRIATRRSPLAMAQARLVAQLLSTVHPGADISLLEVETTGDLDRISSVTTLTEVGAFVRAIQQAVLDGEADLAVHSCKDLPIDAPAELAVVYPEREQPWDVLCGHDLETLPPGAQVGTGSPRRAAQLLRLRPDVEVREIRGNVDTRLGKLDAGEFDAIVLAEAGLRRLGRDRAIGHRFAVREMVPAPGQGALAVEALAGGPGAEAMKAIDHAETRAAVQAERALLARTRAGCRSALGALALVDRGEVEIFGFVEDETGARTGRARAVDSDMAAAQLQEVMHL